LYLGPRTPPLVSIAEHPAEDAKSLRLRHVAVPIEAFIPLARFQEIMVVGPRAYRRFCEHFAKTSSSRAGDAKGLYIWAGRRLKDATDATELVGMRRGKRPWILLGRDSVARMHATRNGLVTGTCYTSPESGYARDRLSIQSRRHDRLRRHNPPATLFS
jgi:hypothetical protein